MEQKLTEKQQLYYDELAKRFEGMGVATPTGLLWQDAISKTDEEIDFILKSAKPVPGVVSADVLPFSNFCSVCGQNMQTKVMYPTCGKQETIAYPNCPYGLPELGSTSV